MKKVASMIHLGNVSSSAADMFPFLNSSALTAQACSRIAVKNIECSYNPTNIRAKLRPQRNGYEFVVFGRSNVGKSTLINTLLQKPVTETSKQPGKTKQLLFLRLKTQIESYIVDAPGYGYASASSKTMIGQWGNMIEWYLRHSYQHHQLILSLVDSEHGIKQTDIMLWDQLARHQRRFMVVFTKCDKGELDIEANKDLLRRIRDKYQHLYYYVHFTSSLTGFGIEDLRNHLFFRVLCMRIEQRK